MDAQRRIEKFWELKSIAHETKDASLIAYISFFELVVSTPSEVRHKPIAIKIIAATIETFDKISDKDPRRQCFFDWNRKIMEELSGLNKAISSGTNTEIHNRVLGLIDTLRSMVLAYDSLDRGY